MRVLISLHRHSAAARLHGARAARCIRDRGLRSRSTPPAWLQHLLARLGVLPSPFFGPP